LAELAGVNIIGGRRRLKEGDIKTLFPEWARLAV